MIKIEKFQVYSTDGKYVHRFGTDTYFKRGTILGNDTEDCFEEVDEVPTYTKAEHECKLTARVQLTEKREEDV